MRTEALAAADQALDFGLLFLSLSFFLIAAALILTALLFVFGAEQRAAETGLFLALGFPARTVRRMLLAEGTVIAVLGTLLGVPLGLLYAWTVVHGLETVWADAVAGSALHFHATAATLAIGCLAGLVCALVSMCQLAYTLASACMWATT